jgi:hypothetical protein
VSIAPGIGHVTLQAMVAINKRAGRYRLRFAGQRVGARVILGGNVLPPRAGDGGEGKRSTEGNRENCKVMPHY